MGRSPDKPFTIGYLGWLGHENLGDDLGPVLFERCLAQHYPHLHERARIEYDLDLLEQADATVAFIGTLLTPTDYNDHWMQRFRRASLRGPLVSLGLGANPAKWMRWPTPQAYNQRLTRWWDFLGVRGRQTADALGLNEDRISGDSVFALEWASGVAPRESDGKPWVAVNAGEVTAELRTPQGLPLTPMIAAACAELVRELNFAVFSMGPRDDQAVAHIAGVIRDAGGAPRVLFQRDVLKLAQELREVSFGITTKCHASGLLYAMGIPTVNIPYKPKCADLATMVTDERFILEWNALTQRAIVDRARDLVRAMPEVRAALAPAVARQRSRWHDMFVQGMATVQAAYEGRYVNRKSRVHRRQAISKLWAYPQAVLRRLGRAGRARLVSSP